MHNKPNNQANHADLIQVDNTICVCRVVDAGGADGDQPGAADIGDRCPKLVTSNALHRWCAGGEQPSRRGIHPKRMHQPGVVTGGSCGRAPVLGWSRMVV